jgi:hypothetical protein
MKLVPIFLLIALQLLISCITLPSDQRPEGKVVERSKQTKPVWSDSPTDQLIVNATEAKIHYFSQKSRDLPIAVKLMQSTAIEKSYPLWKPSFDQRLKEFPKIFNAKTPRNEKEFYDLLEQCARKVHAEAAQIEDIYYEKIQIEKPELVPELAGVSEYFDVHVLVQLKQVDTAKIESVIYQVFSKAKAVELRRVGSEFSPKKP